MSDFLYRAGTVLAPTGSKKHLYIICNDPVFDPIRNDNCVLVVNISSVSEDRDYDDTCILQKGDHPFIKHDSYGDCNGFCGNSKSDNLGENQNGISSYEPR